MRGDVAKRSSEVGAVYISSAQAGEHASERASERANLGVSEYVCGFVNNRVVAKIQSI